MLLKKLKSEWKPSENPGLQVGETIEITDGRELILNGTAVAIGKDGETLDAFDLYNVVDPALVAELKAYKEAKHNEEMLDNLAKEKVQVEKKLADAKASNEKKYKAAELEAMDWTALRAKASDLGLMKPSMKKKQVIELLVAKLC